jgi:hypothetical protein
LEDLGDLNSHSARVTRNIRPAVPERDDAQSRTRVVAMDVAPARLGRVRRLAVEFHGNPELSIAIVEVTSTFASAALRLPEGAWQPVWPFDAPDVPPFQD